MKRRLTLVLAGALALGVAGFAVVALAAGGTPANKAVAAGDHMTIVPANQASGGTPIMTAKIHTSKPEDLILQVTLECSITTDVTVGGNSGMSSSARGQLRTWVEVDGKIVPIQSVSTPPQDPSAQPAGTDSDKVTFCDRLHQRDVTDTENPQDGTDQTRDFLQTKSANAFNWVRLNTGSGDHTIVVKADLRTQNTGTASATGEIGNRSLVVEPTKLANDAIIG